MKFRFALVLAVVFSWAASAEQPAAGAFSLSWVNTLPQTDQAVVLLQFNKQIADGCTKDMAAVAPGDDGRRINVSDFCVRVGLIADAAFAELNIKDQAVAELLQKQHDFHWDVLTRFNAIEADEIERRSTEIQDGFATQLKERVSQINRVGGKYTPQVKASLSQLYFSGRNSTLAQIFESRSAVSRNWIN